MPEVAIYDGEPNAFATGATKNSSLVAVSTGLLQSMTREEAEAVLAHEVAHIANGDMVTLTLIQGVVNTFVVFLSRVVGYLVDSFLRRGEENSGPGIGYMVTSMVCDVVFGVLASIIVAWFSRQREFRADAGAAQLMGSPRADAECAAPPRQPAYRAAAAEHGGFRHRRRPGLDGAVLHPPAARGAHRGARRPLSVAQTLLKAGLMIRHSRLIVLACGLSASLALAQASYDLPRLEALAMESSRAVLASRDQVSAARSAVD